jgi:hypothetical protein
MNDTAVAISRIKRLLDRVKPEKIREVEDFVEFLTEKNTEKPGGKKVRKMEGIWEGLGFENIDVEKEIREIRRESEESILKRSAEWNT